MMVQIEDSTLPSFQRSRLCESVTRRMLAVLQEGTLIRFAVTRTEVTP
jgi:hypothetical protein